MSAGISSVNGVSASFNSAWPLWRTAIARAAPELSPPEIVLQVKALACELPAAWEFPFRAGATARFLQHLGAAMSAPPNLLARNGGKPTLDLIDP